MIVILQLLTTIVTFHRCIYYYVYIFGLFIRAGAYLLLQMCLGWRRKLRAIVNYKAVIMMRTE